MRAEPSRTLKMEKVVRYCSFNRKNCVDQRCLEDHCVVAKECENAFKRLAPYRFYFPKDSNAKPERIWMLAFLKERRAVIRLTCRQSGIRYSAAISRRYLNDERVIFEALRRIAGKIRGLANL